MVYPRYGPAQVGCNLAMAVAEPWDMDVFSESEPLLCSEGGMTSVVAESNSLHESTAGQTPLEHDAAERTAALYRLTHALVNCESLSVLLQTMAEGVGEVLAATHVLLVVGDGEKQQIIAEVAGGQEAEAALSFSFADWWAGVDWLRRSQQTTLLLTPGHLDEIAVAWPACRGLSPYLGSAIVALLQYRHEVMGLLVVLRSSQKAVFGASDIELVSMIADQAALAMANLRLSDALDREKAQLDLVYRLGQHLAKTFDVHDVCRLALEEICATLGNLYGSLFLLDEETGGLRLMAQKGYDLNTIQSLLQDFSHGKGLSGWVMECRQTVVVDDVSADPHWIATPDTFEVRSALAVPLLSGPELLGVLTLASTQRAFFTAEYRALVESAMATIVVAIFNARLFGKMQQRALEQEYISEIARALNLRGISQTFPVLTRILSALVECEYVALILEEQGTFTVAESTIPTLPVGSALSLPPAVMARLTSEQPYITTDLGPQSDDLLLQELHALGVNARVLLPLLVGAEMIGILYLGSQRVPTVAQLLILQQISDMVAITIENDRLFRAEQRQLEIAERLQATALTLNTLDLQKVLTLIMDQLESLFPYDSGSIQILEKEAMVVIATRNAPQVPLGFRFSLQDHPHSRRLAEGEVLIIEDAQQNDMGWIPFPEALYMRSTLGIPLWVRDKVIGALVVDNRTPRRYTPEDIRVVQAFAQQAAVAIENARLFEAQRTQRELAEALQVAAAVVSSVLDFEQVLDYILDQVARIVQGDTFNIILVEGEAGRMIRWRGYPELGMALPESGQERIPLRQYPSLARMIEEPQPVMITDTANDPRWISYPGQEKIRAYIGAPIRIAGKTEGFINVASMTAGQFDEQDLAWLQAFADHASIALQNARLFQQTRRHAEELEQRVHERTAELEAKNAWLEAILGSTSDGIIVTDKEGEIVDANRVAKLWLYHSLPLPDVERLRTLIRDLARRVYSQPEAVIELTGLDLELNAAPVLHQDTAGPAVVIAAHDVSYLKALDRLKSQFISNISHELRTPLSSIRLYSSLLQRGSPEKRARYFTALDQEIARLSKLVEDILQIARIESGQMELKRQLVDLSMLTEMSTTAHTDLAESHGLTLTMQGNAGKAIVSVDRDKLMQVLNNLIGNAIKYTPQGGHITVATQQRTKDGRLWGTVTVTDTGMGIPEAEMPHICERFFRGSQPQELRIQGSGLGLAIVKEILQLHGGALTVESQVGVGSTFTVWLPLIED